MDEISTLDKQIEMLLDYKPIPEHEVKGLCDKVSNTQVFMTLNIGKGNPLTRKQCAASEMPGHSLRRYSRIVP
jgi:hypothetical protein